MTTPVTCISAVEVRRPDAESSAKMPSRGRSRAMMLASPESLPTATMRRRATKGESKGHRRHHRCATRQDARRPGRHLLAICVTKRRLEAAREKKIDHFSTMTFPLRTDSIWRQRAMGDVHVGGDEQRASAVSGFATPDSPI